MRSRLLPTVLVRPGGRSPSLAGCGGSDSKESPKTLVVATHDSWAMSKDVLAKFKAETGITVKVRPQGDAGELTNKLVLTKDSPLADGVYGIDNTFASRAVDEGVLDAVRRQGAALVGASSTGSTAGPPTASPRSTTATCASTSTTPGSRRRSSRRRRRSTT